MCSPDMCLSQSREPARNRPCGPRAVRPNFRIGRRFLEQGIALVLVLWAIALLTVIAGGFAFSMRTATQIANNQTASARAAALADAGVHRALYELNKPANDPSNWKGDGNTHTWKFGDATMNITIRDISGKIDLNTAADELLLGLLKNAGMSELDSQSMLDAIVDWRDADDLPRPHGAEANAYRAAGLGYLPSNAPFATVDELRRVIGMTPEIYARLADSLTVDSHQPGVNSAVASRDVLLAIPGTDPVAVDDFIAQRQAALDNNQIPPVFIGASGFVAGNSGSVYSVRSEAALPDGAVFIREAEVSINPSAVRKVTFLAWQEGETVQAADDKEQLATNGK